MGASSTMKQRKKQTCLSCRHHKHQSTKSGLIVICDGMKKKFNPIPAPWPRCVWFSADERTPRKQHKPFIKLGPGDSIKEEMEFYGWTQKDLAEILDISEKHLSQLINNKIEMTAKMAQLLSVVFKQSPEYWLKLESNAKMEEK